MADQNKQQAVKRNESKDNTPAVAKQNVNGGHGRNIIEDAVVSKVAGLAAREVTGVNALGGGGARTVGAIREAFGASENVQQGVSVEVGETQAAVDLSIVAEYGVAIHELADAIRNNIIRAIERMTGLEVTEVNVTVTDVHVPSLDGDDDDDKDQRELSNDKQEKAASRVQ